MNKPVKLPLYIACNYYMLKIYFSNVMRKTEIATQYYYIFRHFFKGILTILNCISFIHNLYLYQTILIEGKWALIIEKQLLHLAYMKPQLYEISVNAQGILSLQVSLSTFWAGSTTQSMSEWKKKMNCNIRINVFLPFYRMKNNVHQSCFQNDIINMFSQRCRIW